MPQGKIKFYNEKKGFGFISRSGSEDIFFHISDAIADGSELTKGATVSFNVTGGKGGKDKAVHVDLIERKD